MSEATPIVSDQEMLRAYAETIRLKEAEIERLKAEVERMTDQAMHFRDMAEKQGYLLARAADALEYPGQLLGDKFRELIADLREAAQCE